MEEESWENSKQLNTLLHCFEFYSNPSSCSLNHLRSTFTLRGNIIMFEKNKITLLRSQGKNNSIVLPSDFDPPSQISIFHHSEGVIIPFKIQASLECTTSISLKFKIDRILLLWHVSI